MMNATSLYVSTSRLVFQSDCSNEKWIDLYRLVPYLRQSLSCTVCGNLLIEPFTPSDGHCQHHVCKMCVRGRKNLKPSCNWCKDNDKYEENMTLRILLQCYKSLCEHIMSTPIYNLICKQTKATGILNNGVNVPSVSLVEFIEEGAKFQDVFKANSGLTKSAYSILPCVFNPCPPPNRKSNSNNVIVTQNHQQPQQEHQHKQHTHQQQFQLHQQQQLKQNQLHQQLKQNQQHQQPSINKTNNVILSSSSSSASNEQQKTQISHLPPIKTVSNGSAMYSVLYTGIGNKITIKRKTNGDEDFNARKIEPIVRPKTMSKRRGCRCGNATATPGKLTCCGQRCPCYVDQKSCIDCKCRGCRNPHRPDGGKIRPHIPELACYEIQVADDINASFDNNQPPLHLENVNREPLLISSPKGNFKVVNVFTSTSQGSTITNSHHSLSGHHSQINTINTIRNSSHNNHSLHHQIPEISTTLPQILLQKQEQVSLSSSPIHHHHQQIGTIGGINSGSSITTSSSIRSATITGISSGPTKQHITGNTITLSPIILNNSNPFPTQIFNEEEIVTTQCSPSPTQPPPLIELNSSSEHNNCII